MSNAAKSSDNAQSMIQDIVPISSQERRSRVEKVQRLMKDKKVDALLLEPGSSLFYFTGISWYLSERVTVAILPARGELQLVCPAFEEQRLRGYLRPETPVKVWEEHEDPYILFKDIFNTLGITTGKLGIENSVRFFVVNGIAKQLPSIEMVNVDAIVAACRGIKSPAEIAFMQRSNDIAVAAFKRCISELQPGMSQDDFVFLSVSVFRSFGVTGQISIQFGKSTAFPHGSIKNEYLKEGDVVLMDGQCLVEGYHSDITRTFVYGEPTARHKEIWNLEKKAQAAAFKAAQVGKPCENVDIAARKVITDAGLGPGYKVPGLPHRTGHGIGLDVHEWYHMVQGNKTPLAPGMCFSDEPNISIYGEFGVRLEDCIYMTEDGPKFFTQPSPSIDKPFV